MKVLKKLGLSQDNKWGELKFQMKMVEECFNLLKDEGFEKSWDSQVGRNFQWEKKHIFIQIYFRLLGEVCSKLEI